MNEKTGFGATGEFPNGKLNEHDEGELRFGIGIDGAVITIHFGKPVAWIAFDAGQARQIAQALLRKADEIETKV